ncbi:MAG: hypothetical protein H0X24_11615 [Ktedonobacterales bacterium]|nr:hypothetical protein [Ktedonobacterales bacterium]
MRYDRQIPHLPKWAADNGCFAQGDQFDGIAYLHWLSGLQHLRESCLFAVAPDVVGDAAATLKRSRPYLSIMRGLGFPVAYVAQDGFVSKHIPWDALEVLFLGGTDAFKLHPRTEYIVREAKERGKHVHAGRVNSYERLELMTSWGCDTADGTYIAFAPNLHLDNILRWLNRVNSLQQLPFLH